MFRDEIYSFLEDRFDLLSDEQAQALAVACVRIALVCEKNGVTDVEHLTLLDKVERCVEDPSTNLLHLDDIRAYHDYIKGTNPTEGYHAAWACYRAHVEKSSDYLVIYDCAWAAYHAEEAGMDMTEARDLFKQAVESVGMSWP